MFPTLLLLFSSPLSCSDAAVERGKPDFHVTEGPECLLLLTYRLYGAPTGYCGFVLQCPFTPELLRNEEIILTQQGGKTVKHELTVNTQTYTCSRWT